MVVMLIPMMITPGVVLGEDKAGAVVELISRNLVIMIAPRTADVKLIGAS